MAKHPSNHGKAWTDQDNEELRDLVGGNTPTRVIGLKLGRTADAIEAHASDLGLSLKPTNQAPYNRRKK